MINLRADRRYRIPNKLKIIMTNKRHKNIILHYFRSKHFTTPTELDLIIYYRRLLVQSLYINIDAETVEYCKITCKNCINTNTCCAIEAKNITSLLFTKLIKNNNIYMKNEK